LGAQDDPRWDDREPVRAVVAMVVHFSNLDDAEIDVYVATGEPLQVSGAFMIDGLGGAFIDRIESDHLDVIGVSVVAMREMITNLGLIWPSLWVRYMGI